MTRRLAAPDVSKRMARQAKSNTVPEKRVRSILHRMGLRYRIGGKGLPGTPDVVNQRRKWAVFVHGCFWHHHEGCARATIPKSNRMWWVEKFQRNIERDARKVLELERLGFDVLVVWECETREVGHLDAKLRHWKCRIGNPTEGRPV